MLRAGRHADLRPIRGATELGAKLIDSMIELPSPHPELGARSFSELLDSGAVQPKIDEKYPQAIGIAKIARQVAVFGNFPWEILVNERESPFSTSDYPVGIERTPDPRIVNRIIPLTPTAAVRIMPNFDLDRRTADYDFKSLRLKRTIPTRQEVAHVNRLIVRSAEDSVFFAKSAPWVVTSNRHFRRHRSHARADTARDHADRGAR
ncbi:DUF4238 domain-containing protein [Mesorhizobium sp. WSM3626]|uniref:DUF4238 domain-containing protein n=1 Tax=Mesorhizobium sp. WSM3626 TaxID=1040987 RepID=UPI00047F7F15|nr:DUF4238 domain-containing protein [Mesorhizobium sp. WSM3626]